MPTSDLFDQSMAAAFARLRAGEARPAELVDHYVPRLHAFVRARLGPRVRRHESEADVVQSVCRELCEHDARLSFDVEAEFRAWLFKTALNKIREKARYWSRHKRDLDRDESLGGADFDQLTRGFCGLFTPSRVLGAQEELERVQRALELLPEEYREVIALTRIAGLPYAVVAEQLGKSKEATRKLVGRALRKLAELLGPSEA